MIWTPTTTCPMTAATRIIIAMAIQPDESPSRCRHLEGLHFTPGSLLRTSLPDSELSEDPGDGEGDAREDHGEPEEHREQCRQSLSEAARTASPSAMALALRDRQDHPESEADEGQTGLRGPDLCVLPSGGR